MVGSMDQYHRLKDKITITKSVGVIVGIILLISSAECISALPTITPSSDGQEVQGWLGLPDGKPPFPMILDTHGGPHSMYPDSFFADTQAWLDHGLAYCAVNYRGSATFGRAFKEKIWGDIGHFAHHIR